MDDEDGKSAQTYLVSVTVNVGNAKQPSAIQVGQSFDTGFHGTGAFTDSTIVSVKVNGTTIPIGTGG